MEIMTHRAERSSREANVRRSGRAGERVVISWNLLHTGGARVEQVCQLIAQQRPDLVLLQEATAQMDALPDQIGGHYARMALPGRHHGLATWSEAPLQRPIESLRLQRGLIVERTCQILQIGDVSFANVHLSHGQVLNRRQLRRIAGALPDVAAILGDCNMVGAPLLPGFRDVGPREATHWPARVIPLRLDRCFVRGLTCTHSQVLARGASDHWPIMVVLQPI